MAVDEIGEGMVRAEVGEAGRREERLPARRKSGEERGLLVGSAVVAAVEGGLEATGVDEKKALLRRLEMAE